ncbi:MAG: hypothetical protein M3355_11805 [Actinomycetota bacterium]|nr:hypothetical protein [Actinomycetota bacterium]
MKLRGGFETTDPRLDRLKQFDERSRGYAVSELGLPETLRSRSWSLPRSYLCNQGSEGSCVGHGVVHELAAQPIGTSLLDHRYARETVYWEAQKLDSWEGGSYPGASPFYEGTSVLAGVKVAQRLGWLDSYWWAFDVDQALQALVHQGPLIIGVDWTEGMADPRPSGLIRAEGSTLGGHCVCVRGFWPKPRLRGEVNMPPCVVIAQSWGLNHGDGGYVYLPVEDFEVLLGRSGEVSVPVGRKRP